MGAARKKGNRKNGRKYKASYNYGGYLGVYSGRLRSTSQGIKQ